MRRSAHCRGAGDCGLPDCRPTRPGGLPVGSSTLVRSWRSHRPEGGSDSDRYPTGRRPLAGSGRRSRLGRGPPPAASPTMVPQRRSGPSAGTLAPSTASHPDSRQDRVRGARRGRSRLRRGAGGLRGSRRKPAPASCDVANGESPPAPGVQRGAAFVVSRVRARCSRAPWRPLTRPRRLAAMHRGGTTIV